MHRPDVDRLKEEVDSVAFADWKAYMHIDPFLCERMDVLFAWLLVTIDGKFRDSTSLPPKISDYIFSPWAESYWNAIDNPAKHVAPLLKSIFSKIPGVVVGEPARG